MQWIDFLRKSEPRLLALPDAFLRGLEAEEGAVKMEALLALDPDAALLPRDLRAVARWRRAYLRLVEAQRTQSLAGCSQALRTELWKRVWTLDQLAALERVGRLLSTQGAEAPLEAWLAGLKIWEGAAGIARKEATWSCEARSTQHPRFAHYADVLQRSESFEELPAHRWLAGCQGEAEGVLVSRWELPVAAMERQVALYRDALGAAASGRTDASLLQELVTDDLPGWLRRWANERATEEAVESAITSYRELLLQPPLEVELLAAIYIGGPGRPAAIAWLDRDGTLLDAKRLRAEQRAVQVAHALHQALRSRKGDGETAVALPLRASWSEVLSPLLKAISGEFAVHRVREAGLSEARALWEGPPHHHPREVAAAIALGQRLRRPKDAWGRLDPLVLGLAEYQELLDTNRLREALEDERALVAAGRVKPDAFRRTQAQSPAKAKSLNPSIHSLEQLKKGMSLQGIVANVTDFGAFVNVGLAEEGLVHKSELADRFVRHPSEVVRVGQKVTVHVLSTDLKQRRLSLSMRSMMRPKPRSSAQRKAQALRDLDNLFKK